MKTFLTLVATLVMFVAFAAPAAALGVEPEPGKEQVCGPGDSGKIDVAGNFPSLVLTAPAGKMIVGYCVKAGSIQQGDGPELVVVNPGKESVTISHSTGKDISHYSLSFAGITPGPTPTPTTTTDPTPTPTTPTPGTDPTATPTTDPGTTPTTDPPTTGTPDPSAVEVLPLQQTPTPGPPPAQPEQLAVTGFKASLAAIGASILAVGVALTWYGRRRLDA